MTRIAHLSDLHFAKPTFSLTQFFSKRWLGNFNFLFRRKDEFDVERLQSLIPLFKQLEVDYVVISGDIATTSHRAEFEMAARFASDVKKAGIEVFALPGNHDHYTKRAYKNKIFYDYFCPYFSFEGPVSSYNLKDHGVAAKQIKEDWWLVALDTALATSLISSRGFFSPELEKHLEELLSRISGNVVLANHFPFFEQEGPRKALGRREALKNLLRRWPNISLFLHGHTHRQSVVNLQAQGLPIICDSGSTTHRYIGSWNLIELHKEKTVCQPYQWKEDKWIPGTKMG